MQSTNQVDKAGPLWLAFEALVDSLPTWFFPTLAVGILVAVLIALWLALRKRE